MERSNNIHLKKKKRVVHRPAVPFIIGAAVTGAAIILYENMHEIIKGINKVFNFITGKKEEKVSVKSGSKHSVPLAIPIEDEQYIEDISAFICPISQEIMRDPVITPYGHCYDRESITDWLRTHHTDPLTNQPLSLDDITPCYSLKSAIEETIRLQRIARNNTI